MVYRTKTYIAGDWSEDVDAVEQIHKWNDGRGWSLSFVDAHDITSASDSSLNCSIKASLKTRLDSSKRFVLIVGKSTASLRSGGCQLCSSYNSHTYSCAKGKSVDYKSYVDYECEIAKRDISDIVVLYKSIKVDKSLCPEVLRNTGVHSTMVYYQDNSYCWDYNSVMKAFNK